MDEASILRSFSSSSCLLSSSSLSFDKHQGVSHVSPEPPSSLLFFNPPTKQPSDNNFLSCLSSSRSFSSPASCPSSSSSSSTNFTEAPLQESDSSEETRHVEEGEEEHEKRDVFLDTKEELQISQDEQTKKRGISPASSPFSSSSSLHGIRKDKMRRERETSTKKEEIQQQRQQERYLLAREEDAVCTSKSQRERDREDEKDKKVEYEGTIRVEEKSDDLAPRRKDEREDPLIQVDVTQGYQSGGEEEEGFPFWLFVKNGLLYRLLIAKQPGRFSNCFLSYTC